MHPDYERYCAMVEAAITRFLPEVDEKSKTLQLAMEYSLTGGGKRLRPVLLLAACEFCGGDPVKALPYACALEYIHTYSLIHDDLPCMDNDDLRRGKPTNHKVFGESMALLAGDALLNSAMEIMLQDILLNMDDVSGCAKKVRAINEIIKGSGCRGMVAGQCADLESENKKCSKEMLDYIHLNKTGALIMAAVRAGAYLACKDINLIEDLTNYAEKLGLAFQIRDDLLDILGDETTLGKRTGVDQPLNKATYPALYGMEASQEKIEETTAAAVQIMEFYEEKGAFFVSLAKELTTRTA